MVTCSGTEYPPVRSESDGGADGVMFAERSGDARSMVLDIRLRVAAYNRGCATVAVDPLQ